MSVVAFPATRVAQITHVGEPAGEHDTVRRLVAWKLRLGLTDSRCYRSYGVHFTDPRVTRPAEHRVDFCLSYDGPVEANPEGVVAGLIPAARCATSRHVGSRSDIAVAAWLHDVWLPASGEGRSDLPIFFHYVNVGPRVAEADMVTDVYLPLG